MSSFTAIWAVSRTLQALLDTQIKADPQLSTTSVPISLFSPKALRESGSTVPSSSVSIWLYRVMRNEFTLNNRPNRTIPNQLPGPPIPINLYYLITPMNEDPELQQLVLGKILQVFNDYAILRGNDLQESLQGTTEELRLSLETLSLEELTRVWHSLQEPYQLSASYLVQVVTIESSLDPVQASPVLTRNSTYAQILDSQ
ncbi:MAG: hypothetical protein NVS4B7_17730 [Ktedonobacteraceae bacterium]